MGKNTTLVLYGLLMVTVIVAMDVLFFRRHIGARLVANVAVVAAFALFYMLFLQKRL